MLLRTVARLRAAGRHLLVGWYAWRHPALKWPGKLVLLGMAVYVLSPVDVVPDWIPVLGWIDDFLLIGVVLPLFMKLLPAEVVRQARKSARINKH